MHLHISGKGKGDRTMTWPEAALGVVVIPIYIVAILVAFVALGVAAIVGILLVGLPIMFFDWLSTSIKRRVIPNDSKRA